MGQGRVASVLGNVPLSAGKAAINHWLTEVDTLLAGTPAGPDRARLLEARAAIRAGLAPAEDPGPSGGSRGSDGPAEDAVGAAGLYEAAGMAQDAAASYAIAACVAARTGELTQALELAVRSLVSYSSVPERERDPRAGASLAIRLGLVCGYVQDYPRAVEFAEVAVSHSERAQDRVRWSVATHNAAEMLLWQAARGPARERCLDRAEHLARRVLDRGEPDAFREMYGPRLLAAVLCERGRPRQAWSLLESASGTAGSQPRAALASLHRVRGRCLSQLGRPSDALTELDRAVHLLEEDGDFTELVDALRTRARVREAVGDLPGALGDSRLLVRRLWARHERQGSAFMNQVLSRVGTEGERRVLLARTEILTRTAEQDPLTGLANRRAVERMLTSTSPEDRVCMVLLDVDHFKAVNDGFGHAVGDEVLRRLGRLLVSAVRSVDRVVRWGGEEFLVVMPGHAAPLGREAGERVRRVVASYPWTQVRADLRLTVSVGVACGRVGAHTEILHSADRALYEAKRAGRDRVVVSADLPDPADLDHVGRFPGGEGPS